MRRPSCGILFLLLTLTGLNAADWQVPEAPYRITAKPEKADAPSSLDLSEILLPVPAKSLKVFADGKPVGFRLRDNGSLAVHPAKGAAEYRIYLGVTPEQPADQWGNPGIPCPPPERLNMTFFGGGGQICTVPEFISNRNNAIARSSRWMIRHSAWQTYRLLMALHLNSDLPLEPPRARQQLQALERNSRRIASRNAGQRRAQYLAILSGGRSTARELANRKRNRQQQLKNQLKWVINESAKLAKRYQQVQIDAPEGPERDLLGIVSRRWRRDYIATEVQMMTRPPETSEYYSCRFYGMLQIPEDGEYEFELLSNALTLVRLDGETVGRHHGTGGTPAETVRFKRKLTRGSHDFELYHRLNTGVGRMLLSMRRGENEPFRLLTSDDFEPARPLGISALENRKGRKLPVINRHAHYQLYTGKQSKLELAQFTVRGEQEGVEFTWNGSDSRPLSELPKRIALPTRGNTGLAFTCKNGEPLMLPVESRDRQDAVVPVPADIFLKLWLPATLYDHETLDGQAEICSKLPEAIDITFSLRSIADAPTILQQERKTLSLPAKPDERFDRFAADLSLKLPLTFRGTPLRKTETYELTLEMPGLQFDSRKIRIVPVGADLKLTATPEGLIDGEGNRAILLQHRPTLAELRNWELLRKLDDELRKDRKILVIGEDFGTGEMSFSHQLELNLKASGRELDFVPAPSEPSPLPAMIAASWPRISASDATSALLLLPCPSHLAGTEPWLRDRYISALIEKLKANPNIRQVTLAALPGPESLRAESAELASALRRLAREYNTNALDLRPPLEELLKSAITYQRPGSLNEYTTHPAGAADKIASILSKMLH